MSLTKFLRAPIKLFKKEVITFFVVRRYDLGVTEDKLRYVAVKPSASISVLRHKIWFLLNLPDYCEELIILKSADNIELPLTALRNGNEPQRPYLLEVWPSEKRKHPSTNMQYMLTLSSNTHKSNTESESNALENCPRGTKNGYDGSVTSTISHVNNPLHIDERKPVNSFYADYKKSELSCRVSSTSFFKINGKKSRDNFIHVLLKIQSDLSTLSNKLSTLENKIPV
ncbi:uncharacterized protein LOC114245567 [Bombyx mandarina]|uniref:Uncharacterized protein LOC114245567 n=1 Tax=Bombyx mandarina TaxID=7092 RepID=A0A6J2JVM7_BOMMA|nr:uncharacterized protein LOC114245567 [Bombyx mandarina]